MALDPKTRPFMIRPGRLEPSRPQARRPAVNPCEMLNSLLPGTPRSKKNAGAAALNGLLEAIAKSVIPRSLHFSFVGFVVNDVAYVILMRQEGPRPLYATDEGQCRSLLWRAVKHRYISAIRQRPPPPPVPPPPPPPGSRIRWDEFERLVVLPYLDAPKGQSVEAARQAWSEFERRQHGEPRSKMLGLGPRAGVADIDRAENAFEARHTRFRSGLRGRVARLVEAGTLDVEEAKDCHDYIDAMAEREKSEKGRKGRR